MTERAATHVLDAIGRAPWAIEPAALEQIITIAGRLNDHPDPLGQVAAIAERLAVSPDALATRGGLPLPSARHATVHGNTALLEVRGPIMPRADLFSRISGATSLEILARDFQVALDDLGVERIVLWLASPGGQTTGIAEFAGQVAAANQIKPITAYVGDLAASAAYWIAAAAGEVVLSQTAMVGSIGVVLTHRPEVDAPLQVVSSQSPLKRATPDTPQGLIEAQRIVDQIATVFVEAVAAGRQVDPQTVLNDFGRGSMLVGAHAVAAGMGDRVGTLNSLLYPAGRARSNRRSIITMSDQTPGAPTIDRAYLVANHPDLLSALLAEGREAGLIIGRVEGATAERARIQAVREQLIPGHEALIERLAMDGQTTGPEAAVAVLAAERTLRIAAQQALGAAPKAVNAANPPEAKDEAKETSRAAREAQRAIFNQVAGGKA